MASYTNKSGGPRILNTTQGPVTLQDGETRDDLELSEGEAANIQRVGLLDAPEEREAAPTVPSPTAAPEAPEDGDVEVTAEDRAFAETFVSRKLDDIQDHEIPQLTPGQRQAVLEAEQDREVPRKGLLSRLGQ